jgi:hypothetical protein
MVAQSVVGTAFSAAAPTPREDALSGRESHSEALRVESPALARLFGYEVRFSLRAAQADHCGFVPYKRDNPKAAHSMQRARPKTGASR